MYGNYETVEETDTSLTTVSYTYDVKDMQYTIIGDNIKNDFKFLIEDIPNLLDESLNTLNKGTSIQDAFYFENGTKVQDLMHVYDEIKRDLDSVKQELATLHSAFMTDIDNVNAELASNFGHIMFLDIKEAGRVVSEKSVSE